MEGTNMGKEFSEEDAKEILAKESKKAEELLNNKDEMDAFLIKLEKTIKKVPFVGKDLASVTILAELLNDYVKKNYTEIPVRSIISVIGALLYLVLPADFIPDFIPGVGYVDDLAVIKLCLKLINADLEDYKKWRKSVGKSYE